MVSCLMGDSTALASAIVRCCPKNEKDNLSAAERNAIRKLIEQLEQFLKTKCEKGRLR